MYSPAARPSRTRAAPAKKRMLSEQTGISSRAAAIGLPTFRDSISASSSVCSSIRSASLSRTSERSCGVVSLHSGHAFFAASTARSTSASVPCGTSAIVSPVAGLMISAVPPSAASTNSPPTRFLCFSTLTLMDKTSWIRGKAISLAGTGGCCCDAADAGRLARQALRDPDGDDREEDHGHGDDVDDRELLRPGEVPEEPDRERLLGPRGERRHDYLVEREREREQGAGEKRGP